MNAFVFTSLFTYLTFRCEILNLQQKLYFEKTILFTFTISNYFIKFFFDLFVLFSFLHKLCLYLEYCIFFIFIIIDDDLNTLIHFNVDNNVFH